MRCVYKMGRWRGDCNRLADLGQGMLDWEGKFSLTEIHGLWLAGSRNGMGELGMGVERAEGEEGRQGEGQ